MSSAASVDSEPHKNQNVVTAGAYPEKPGSTYRADYTGEFSEEELAVINEHIDDYTIEECLDIVRKAVVYHDKDPALEPKYIESLQSLTEGHSFDETPEEWEYRLKFETFLIHNWSIYSAVRSVTAPYEEPDEGPVETIRVYIVSVLWSCAGSTLSTFFIPRFPSISISTIALQVLISYSGKALAFIPGFSFPVGFGRRCHFGNGRWTYKEQMLASAGMSVGDSYSYSNFAVIAMANKQFYNFEQAQSNFGFSILLTLSSNLMGFGLAGLFRVFLVYPVRYIWWGVLPTIRLSRILVTSERKETINGWSLSGTWMFWIAAVLNFCWYWITNYVFTFLAYFNWITWINSNSNNNVAITDIANGMGYSPFTSLDPTTTGISSMITPFYATLNNWVGMFLSGLVVIGMCYMNVSYTGFIPINNPSLHTRFGGNYRVTEILNEDHKLDKDKFMQYGLPFWSAGSLVSYGSFFAFYPAIIVYSILEYGRYILEGVYMFAKVIRRPADAMIMFNDRFARSQRKYKEVPEWWYAIALLGCIGAGIGCVEHFTFTETPVWTIFVGIGLSAIFMVPCGVLYAVTNTQVVINVLFELIIGLAIPGNGNALMISKTYAANFMLETDNFITNLKVAHYCSIAPRAMFRVQMVNMICNSFVQAGLTTWQSSPNGIPDMCDRALIATNRFICQQQRIYFNAAVQWGTIGPKRVLRDLYPGMRYTFLFGACLPLPFWFLRHFALAYARRHKFGGPKEGSGRIRNLRIVRDFLSLEWVVHINEIIFLTGALQWGSASLGYITTTVYLGYLTAHYLPKHYPKWWAKYNYLIYAGSTVGMSISAIVVFFAVQYKNIPDFEWWGNTGATSLTPLPRLNATELAPDGFGPKTWRW